jgi:hypothetical protein
MIIGPRRVGKTLLLNRIAQVNSEGLLYINGETFGVAELFARKSKENYQNILGNTKLLIIDEAQNIPNIGSILKFLVDEIEGLRIIVSGSSSFDIMNKSGEPLTGRMNQFRLFPFSENELSQIENNIEKAENLRNRLVYGSYPELYSLSSYDEKAEYLSQLVNSYLFKDILAIDNIKNSSKLISLLRLIAFQTGSLVSYQELGTKLCMSKNTVEKYLDLLSKVFVLFKIEGFSRNLRKEISKTHKWYFYDNGIRNFFTGNFKPIELRDDIGILWENYILSERIKFQNNTRMIVYNYFWRTYDKQEIDLIEDRNGKLHAYEFKWSDENPKVPSGWRIAYPDASFELVNKFNYLSFLS